MKRQEEPPEYLTSAEVARIYNVGIRSVNRWVKEGKIVPAFLTPGGHARFRTSEIRQVTADNAEKSEITVRND